MRLDHCCLIAFMEEFYRDVSVFETWQRKTDFSTGIKNENNEDLVFFFLRNCNTAAD